MVIVDEEPDRASKIVVALFPVSNPIWVLYTIAMIFELVGCCENIVGWYSPSPVVLFVMDKVPSASETVNLAIDSPVDGIAVECTCNEELGAIVPIPTLPEEEINNLFVPTNSSLTLLEEDIMSDPVIPYEPVNCFEFIQTLPLFISKSPYEPVVVLSITSCNSPSSCPLSTRT